MQPNAFILRHDRGGSLQIEVWASHTQALARACQRIWAIIHASSSPSEHNLSVLRLIQAGRFGDALALFSEDSGHHQINVDSIVINQNPFVAGEASRDAAELLAKLGG